MNDFKKYRFIDSVFYFIYYILCTVEIGRIWFNTSPELLCSPSKTGWNVTLDMEWHKNGEKFFISFLYVIILFIWDSVLLPPMPSALRFPVDAFAGNGTCHMYSLFQTDIFSGVSPVHKKKSVMIMKYNRFILLKIFFNPINKPFFPDFEFLLNTWLSIKIGR